MTVSKGSRLSDLLLAVPDGVIRRPDGPPEGAEEPVLWPVRQAVSGHRLLQERAGRLPVLRGLRLHPGEGAPAASRGQGPRQHPVVQGSSPCYPLDNGGVVDDSDGVGVVTVVVGNGVVGAGGAGVVGADGGGVGTGSGVVVVVVGGGGGADVGVGVIVVVGDGVGIVGVGDAVGDGVVVAGSDGVVIVNADGAGVVVDVVVVIIVVAGVICGQCPLLAPWVCGPQMV